MRKLIILFAACAIVVAYTVPVVAAEWDFYGIARMRTIYADDDEKAPKADVTGASAGYSDTDLHWGRSLNATWGGTVKVGDLGGKVEYSPLGLIAHNDFIQFYGTWDFGAGEMLLGKTFGPLNYFVGNQIYSDENCCLSWGGILSWVKPMIQFTFGNLKVALLEPEPSSQVYNIGGIPPMQMSTSQPVTNSAFTDHDTSLPKIEASYTFAAGPASITPLFGYQSWDGVIATATTETEYGVDSYVLGLGWKIGLGAAYINGNIYVGQNLGQYDMTFQFGSKNAMFDAASNEIKDNDAMGYLIVVGYQATETIRLEAGYGEVEFELDMPGTWEDDTGAMYVQAVIALADGVSIIPEVGVIDYGEDSITQSPGVTGAAAEQGETTYFGARWEIAF
jgi:hypothetical protein